MIKTIENLAKAFIGESMARNRYTMYAEIAQKEGYIEVAEQFIKTADQEKMHARLNFMLIKELEKEKNLDLVNFKIDTDVPVDLGSTKDNLKAAINGEKHEYTKMYPEFALIAEKEGYQKIASKFRAVAKAEENHTIKYKALLKRM